MTKGLEKLIFLLAASGLSEQAIYAAWNAARRHHPADITKRVSEVRRATAHAVREISNSSSSYFFDSRTAQIASLIDDISKMLLEDAKLPPSKAARELSNLIAKSKSAAVSLEFRPKEGFRKWMERIAPKVPPSELLHYATRVRNSVVHNRPTDWPLRDREK